MMSKNFVDGATRWSAFEREFYFFKEGSHAVAKYVNGFTLFTLFDHENIERAESVRESRRASKKLVSWIADIQHILARGVSGCGCARRGSRSQSLHSAQ